MREFDVFGEFDEDEEEANGAYVLVVISDLVSNLLYYDRKEDDILKIGMIEKFVKNGELTIDEMVEAFRQALLKGLK